MNLKFTRQSKQDLDDIWDYIAEDNQNAADDFVDLLHNKCRLLAETPEMGRQRPEIEKGIRSFPVSAGYHPPPTIHHHKPQGLGR